MRIRRPRSPWKWLLLWGVLLGWLATLVRMWSALWRVPSPELLKQQRMVRPPTLASLWIGAGASLVEVAVLTLLLWPRWTRFYRLRLLVAALGTAVWFVMSTPLAITSLQRVHRQWLALVAVVLFLAFLLSLAWSALRVLRRP